MEQLKPDTEQNEQKTREKIVPIAFIFSTIVLAFMTLFAILDAVFIYSNDSSMSQLAADAHLFIKLAIVWSICLTFSFISFLMIVAIEVLHLPRGIGPVLGRLRPGVLLVNCVLVDSVRQTVTVR